MAASSTSDQLEITGSTGCGINALAFAANGEHIVSGEERCIRVWRVEDGEELAKLAVEGSILCIAVSNDGKWIAAGSSWDGWVLLWNAKTFERVFGRQEEYSVCGVDFSPDSTMLLVASWGTATVFDVAAPGRIQLGPLRHSDWVYTAKYSLTGDRIATVTMHSVLVWDSADGHLLLKVKAAVTSPYNKGLLWVDRNHLLVVSREGIRMLETFTGSSSSVRMPCVDGNSCIILPRHGKFFIYAANRTVFLRDTATNTRSTQVRHPDEISSIALCPDNQSVATGGRNGKIVITDLSSITAGFHPDYFHWQEHIGIDNTSLDYWKNDRLLEAEVSLTAAIAQTSLKVNHYALSCRALVRARLKRWDAAICDAEESIGIEPSLLGYIAKSIALNGKGEKHKAYRACDLAFQFHHSTHTVFVLLLKAVIVFIAGEHKDALSRVDDLIATSPLSSICYMVRAQMLLLMGNLCIKSGDHGGAIWFLKCARAGSINYNGDGPSDTSLIALIFGWHFDGLDIVIRQRFCEALYSAGRMKEACETLLEMTNAFSEEIHASQPLSEWMTGFTCECLSASQWDENTLLNVDKLEVDSSHEMLHLMTILLQEWAKSALLFRPWRDVVIHADSFKAPRVLVYRSICERLETLDHIIEASQCFCQLVHESGKNSDCWKQYEQEKWALDFKQRCLEKLIDQGDVESGTGRHDNAIAYYSAALCLNPDTPQAVLIKRSKVFMLSGLWGDALGDAEQVIMLEPLSPWGYERKHAALYEAGDYGSAAEAFDQMLSKMLQSSDLDIRERHRNYADPVKTMEIIRKTVQDVIRDSPRVLINTATGRLCNKSEQATAFESLPIFKQLIASMTTHVDCPRIEKVVKEYYRYATLSHKWEENEPLFEKVTRTIVYDLEKSLTHDKLQMFCKVTQDSGFHWAWSDTCCIDKTDHVVLQEAIVAMFKWYEGSSLTVIFLRGVRSPCQPGDLVESTWNSRAWTFQEYHASKVVRFYTEDWKLYMDLDIPNHKECPSIVAEVEGATGISAQALTSLRPGLDDIRTKLYLASQRETTLVEDAAYSLLGIFSISLPVVYGEGDKALGRLLAQLLASSGDTSILAWIGKSGSFNSCFPANISAFGKLPTTHISLVTNDVEMEKTISGINPAPAMKLYDHLLDLPVPSFSGRRMKLPCITFKLGAVSASRNGLEHTFRAQTTVLGIVQIQTTENLAKLDSLYLIHPWIDSLLNRQPVGSVVETALEDLEDANDLSSAGGLESLSSNPLDVTRLPRPSRASRFATRLGLPFGGQSGDVSSLRPPSSVSQSDKLVHARRTITRLKKPFTALLFTPSPGGVAAFRRVATESLITVQLVEDITPTILNKLIESVRILDVL